MKYHIRTRINNHKMFCLAAVAILLLISSGTSSASTIFVSPGESIQAAVNNASPEDTIIVRDGTYNENILVNVENLTIRSENGPEFTMIQALVSEKDVFKVTNDSVTISGFHITGAINSYKCGIYLYNITECSILNNTISNNYRGIYFYNVNECSILNNAVSNNNYNGISLEFSNNNTLSNNTALNNNDQGISLLDSKSNILSNNTVSSNNDNGIYLYFSDSNTLENNGVSNNDVGIYLSYSSSNSLSNNTASYNRYYGTYIFSSNNNTLENNTINSNKYHGIRLDSSNSNTLNNNGVSNNYYGIDLYPSSNNKLFLNELRNNSIQVRGDGINNWNSSEPINYLYKGKRQTSYLGNYYSDYSGPDTDDNCIGDTPYEYDIYPLLAPSDNYVQLAPDSEAPLINSVELSSASLCAGDSILVTVNVTDNIGVFSVEASEILLTCTGGDIWQGSLVAEEGTHPVNVSASDAWGNVAWDNSSSYTVTVDKEAPSGVSDLQATAGLTWINWTWNNPPEPDFNHTVLCLDGTFLANTSDSYYNVTGLLENTEYGLGTLTVDFSGNINETWINDTATTNKTESQEPSGNEDSHSSSGSSGGSGGGGGGGGSPEPASNIEFKELSQQFVTNGNTARFDFPEGVTCVCYVAFDPKRTFGKTFTNVEMLKGKSALVDELPAGIVYKNVNIWVGNEGVASPENIGNAVIGFRIEKAWFESNGADENSILLYRYSDEEWAALSTRVTGDDENFVYFEAETTGYSPFTIVASRVEITEKETSEYSGTTGSLFDAKDGDGTPEAATEGGEEKSPGFGAGFALAGIVCALCVLRGRKRG